LIGRISILLILSVFCRAQTPGKTVVFKVRAPATKCTISSNNSFFFLEINNPVIIKLQGRNKNISVEVSSGGKIITKTNDTYFIRFLRPGMGVVSVYLYTPTGKKLIATKMQEIRSPAVYFCGIKMDSSSRSIKLRGINFYAYSEYYKIAMPIASFDMYYVDDTTLKKIEPIKISSDSCMISPEMRKRILRFQPLHNYIYFHNIICNVPDGSKRMLDPIELNVVVDTANRKELSLKYSVRRKKD
jgi:hypothetical protein